MRYNFSSSLWVLVYLIFVWHYKPFNCNDICRNPDLQHYENVIIENDSYRYSLHNKYSMRIHRSQSNQVPSDRFKNKINGIYYGKPQFSCSYYGSHVRQIHIYKYHGENVFEFGGSHIGTIISYIENYKKSESRVLDEKELLGVKRNFSINVNGSDVTATMTNLIHPNGKVSLFYDNIPTEIEESKLQSEIYGLIRCEKGPIKSLELYVPAKWIKSGTLVEFEAIGEICSQYNTSETCQNATTLNMTCIWCDKGRACIESNDQNTHGLKVNDCRVEKNPDVNDLNSSTTMKHSETTLGIAEVEVSENLMKTTEERYEHLNMNIGVTEEDEQDISDLYLFVVFSLVASLFFI